VELGLLSWGTGDTIPCSWHMDHAEEHTQHFRPGLPVSFQLFPGKQKCGLFFRVLVVPEEGTLLMRDC